MSFEIKQSTFGEKGRSLSNNQMLTPSRGNLGNKTDLEDNKPKLSDSIFDNVQDQNVRSDFVREQSDVDGKSSSANFSINAIIDGKNPMLKFNPVNATMKVKGFRNVQQTLDRKPKKDLKKVVFESIQFGFEEFGQNQTVEAFRKELEITQNLEEMLERLSQMKIDNQVATKEYLTNKGLYLFESLQDKLNTSNKNYEKDMGKLTVGESPNEIQVQGVEKFQINEEHDFKEWERYDIMMFKSKSNSVIPIIQYPTYIREDILHSCATNIVELKSGYKSGKKLSDPDVKWVEKWFEVKSNDAGVKKDTSSQILVKSQSKFWTNIEDNTIEGSSCLQVLNKHHGLLMEMKNNYKVSNFLNREGSLRKRTIKVKKNATRQFDIIADQSISNNREGSQFQSGFRISENENPVVVEEEIPDTVVLKTTSDFRNSLMIENNPQIFDNLGHSRQAQLQQNPSDHLKNRTVAPLNTPSSEYVPSSDEKPRKSAVGSSIHNINGPPKDIASRYKMQQE